jgi:probable HAF family extracellular repeat protein
VVLSKINIDYRNITLVGIGMKSNCFGNIQHLCLVILVGVGFAISAKSYGAAYTFTDLGTLGGSNSYVAAINSSGHIVGYSFTDGDFALHATLWKGTKKTDLDPLGKSTSMATDINNNGQVVGSSPSATYGQSVTLWHGSLKTDLGGVLTSIGGINNKGQVVGAYGELGVATLWDGTERFNLGTLGGSGSFAGDINDSGQVTGFSYTTANEVHATLWNGIASPPTDLGTLGGKYSYANAINSLGQVVGVSSVNDYYPQHATLWNGTKPTDLGSLGGDSSKAYDINNIGQVVGTSQTVDGVYHATLWSGADTVDLNTVLDSTTVGDWVLNSAISINNNGWIVGQASNNPLGIQSHAFLLIPKAVPVPAAFWLFCSAMLSLFGVNRYQKLEGVHNY